MITLRYVSTTPCNHQKDCGCLIRVEPVQGQPLEHMDPFEVGGTTEDQNSQIASRILSQYAVVEGKVIPSRSDQWAYHLINRLHHSPNMKLVPPPIPQKAGFVTTFPYEPPTLIKQAMQYADRQVLPKYYDKFIDFKILHSAEEKVDEFHTEVRKRSAYWSAYGTTNGRPFRIAAAEGADGLKTIDAALGYSRNTRELNPAGKEAIKHIDEAVARLYNAMGYQPEDLGKERSVIDFSQMSAAYLGSSAGLDVGSTRKEKLPTGEPIIISPNGKKIDVIKRDFNRILEYLNSDKDFETYFTMVPKVENFFSWDKQNGDEEFLKWKKKMRLFNIPTSTFVLAEKLVSKLRMMKERGWVIQIGFKWAHGGADILARYLGIDNYTEFLKILVEGDLRNMDQTVHSFFVKLYMDTMLIHEDKNSVDYGAKKKLLEYLVPRIVERLTRLYADVWVLHYGGVPSGCFNTSHMDSWIMGLYFFLFCTLQIVKAPEEDKIDLEALVAWVKLVVYGDDHLYNKGMTRVSHYLSGFNFQAFLKEAFDVDLKDIYDGVSYLSAVSKGRITKRGACFLKYFFVLNTETGELQPRYLPFREVNEIMIRAVYGRETESRDMREFILGLIGHAYGTYASNRIAYDLLYQAFVFSISHVKLDFTDPSLKRIMDMKSLRKLRLQGITFEHLVQGFPDWSTLVKQNEIKPGYHDTRQEEFEEHYSTELPEDW